MKHDEILKKMMMLMSSTETVVVLCDWLDGKLDSVTNDESAEDQASMIMEDPNYKLLRQELKTLKEYFDME